MRQLRASPEHPPDGSLSVESARGASDIDAPTTSTPVGGRDDGQGSALSFTDVTKVFPDGTEAFEHVTFDLSRGDFVTIVGPSGCGKSTILRVASGLLQASSGRVELNDPNLGYVFQDPTLLAWRTVQRNVELLAELRRFSRERRRRLAAEAIELVGLSGFERHHPARLSGGMRMRVSLARSLTLNPKVFLFDEPFGALDEITRSRLNEELLRLFVHERFSALFITHSIFESVFLSTRVLVMSPRPGRVIAEFEVPFPYPRDTGLRFEREFTELSSEVSSALRRASNAQGLYGNS